MNAIEVFAGIGGMSPPPDTGINVIKAYEWDRAACDVYERIAGHPIEQCDLSVRDMSSLPSCDLIFGGPPCQEFSSGGKRAGADGVRNMWPVAVEAVRVKRPAMFVFENVKGLIQGKHRPYFESVLKSFRDMGYTVAWRLLNAADYGVPQTRERVFIVGRRDGLRIEWPAETHWNRNAGMFYSRWVSWGAALQDWLSTAELYTKPFPNWLMKIYDGTLPDTAMFDGHQKGSGKTRQHRGMDEPSFTLVASNAKSVVRMKIGEAVYRLDVSGMAILQTLPHVAGLSIRQIGNSVPPMMAAALFRSLVGIELSEPIAA